MRPHYATIRAPRSATNQEELHEMRRRAWRTQGLACLQVDQIGDDWLRVSIENLCRELYGPRSGALVSERGVGR